MTKKDFESKQRIVSAMCATADKNGIHSTWYEMEAVAKRLHRLEATLSRLAEEESCEPSYDEAKQERIEKLAEKVIRDNIGCRCYTQRDPRGYCIRMYLVDENGNVFTNIWDGETTGLAW